MRETGAEVETIAELAYSKGNVGARGIVKIVLAVSDSTDITSVEQMPPGSRISTVAAGASWAAVTSGLKR